MSIVVAGAGTFGDHAPLFGLARALKARGHNVRMAVNAAMLERATRAGLEGVEVGRELGQRQARRHAVDWDHWTAPQHKAWRWGAAADAYQLQSFQELRAACQGAALLVSPCNDLTGTLVHEQTGIRWVSVALTPALVAYKPPALEDADDLDSTDDGHRTDSHQDSADVDDDGDAHFRSLAGHLRRVRAEIRLPDRPLSRQFDDWYSSRLILASSPAFGPPPAGEYAHAEVTGFWLPDDPDWASWKPSRALARFVDAEPRPLVLSFSSLPLADPGRVLAAHASATMELGRRLIVQRGWAGFSPRHLSADVRREDVMFIGAVPHDWLFARCDAVFQHGGIGSIARALRNTCPIVVEPYGNDQFLNARQVVTLGLGAAMHPHKLKPSGLVRVLRDKVLTPECRTRVETIGRVIRAENGLERGADLIESWLP